jgi:hypothetical protein
MLVKERKNLENVLLVHDSKVELNDILEESYNCFSEIDNKDIIAIVWSSKENLQYAFRNHTMHKAT